MADSVRDFYQVLMSLWWTAIGMNSKGVRNEGQLVTHLDPSRPLECIRLWNTVWYCSAYALRLLNIVPALSKI